MSNLDLTVDLSYLDTIAGGEPEFIIEMVDLFMAQTPIYISEFEIELDKSNWPGVSSIAHKIKPTLAFIGVNSIMEVMGRIEVNAKKLENLETITSDFELVSSSMPLLFENLEKAKSDLRN